MEKVAANDEKAIERAQNARNGSQNSNQVMECDVDIWKWFCKI